ncbi:34189_t:CDS:2, partial [Gigaspora margarita]
EICDAAAKEWKNIKKFKETRINDIIKEYLDTSIKLRGFIGTTISSKKTKVSDTISSFYHTVEIIPIEQEIQNNAPAQKRTATKALEEKQEVVRYDKCGRPSYLLQHPDLLEHIYDSIEYGSADIQRHKEAIKVRIVNHLKKNLEQNYGIYMARTTLNNYLLSHRSNSLTAKAHHHPAWVAMARVSRDETKYHPDGHYCLASVKGIRQFAQTFADFS